MSYTHDMNIHSTSNPPEEGDALAIGRPFRLHSKGSQSHRIRSVAVACPDFIVPGDIRIESDSFAIR
jgi:hypothetical protein